MNFYSPAARIIQAGRFVFFYMAIRSEKPLMKTQNLLNFTIRFLKEAYFERWLNTGISFF